MAERALSLYIHIPFCVQKCLYCDFHSAPASEAAKMEYTDLLCREIKAWGKWLREESGEAYFIKTIFIGGGTPNCLQAQSFASIGQALQENFDLSRLQEFTTEANPGMVTGAHLAQWKEMGINRVSLGLQSAQDGELARLGRIHDYAGFLKSYDMLRQQDFSNINVDLMSAIPGQTMQSYEDTLQKVVGLVPEHISAYSLIIEPGTVFEEMEESGKLYCPGEDEERQMYKLTGEYLAGRGYQRYEISNYAREGKECQHNIVYWTGGEYLGLGENASSYLGGYRFSVPAERKAYARYVEALERKLGQERERLVQDAIENGEDGRDRAMNNSMQWDFWLESAREVILTSRKMQMEEFMFLGLRITQGVSKREFERNFYCPMEAIYGEVIARYMSMGLLGKDSSGDKIFLTKRGIDVSNQILADFLLEE